MKQRFLGMVLAALWVVMISCAADGPVESGPAEAPLERAAPAEASSTHSTHSTSMPKELRAAYIEARQREASEAYAATEEGVGAFRMDNPAGRFRAALDRAGVVLSPEDKPWSLSLVTVGFGCEGAEQAVAEAEPEADADADGRRVRYPREGLEEWYLNGPLGLEQGFSMGRAPDCAGTKVVRWQAGGELEARLEDDDGDGRGEAVRFVDEEGRAEARVAELYVKDAAGKMLPAWMTVVEGQVAIHWEDAGAVYPVVVDPVIATQVAKLFPDHEHNSDHFGESVAVSGDRALVGASNDDDKGPDSGAAYVFVRNGGSWTQQAKLTADDGAAGDYFGGSVALDGDTALVGADRDDDKGQVSGAAYVFVRDAMSGSWTQQAKLTADDGAASDYFGYSVALDVDTALVGALYDNDKGVSSGSAYVFVRDSGGSWTQQAKLTADDGAEYDIFG